MGRYATGRRPGCGSCSGTRRRARRPRHPPTTSRSCHRYRDREPSRLPPSHQELVTKTAVKVRGPDAERRPRCGGGPILTCGRGGCASPTYRKRGLPEAGLVRRPSGPATGEATITLTIDEAESRSALPLKIWLGTVRPARTETQPSVYGDRRATWRGGVNSRDRGSASSALAQIDAIAADRG
jgi:hypothetical protein